jgi:site-specific DNA-methyltransferase (adenine-specific)
MSMTELSDESVHLIITSPPYFNAPFDYKGLFVNYEQYLGVIKRMAREAYRVLQNGRIFALNIDDMLVNVFTNKQKKWCFTPKSVSNVFLS